MDAFDKKKFLHDGALLGAAAAALTAEHFFHPFTALAQTISGGEAGEIWHYVAIILPTLGIGAMLGVLLASACLHLACQETWRLLSHRGDPNASGPRKIL